MVTARTYLLPARVPLGVCYWQLGRIPGRLHHLLHLLVVEEQHPRASVSVCFPRVFLLPPNVDSPANDPDEGPGVGHTGENFLCALGHARAVSCPSEPEPAPSPSARPCRRLCTVEKLGREEAQVVMQDGPLDLLRSARGVPDGRTAGRQAPPTRLEDTLSIRDDKPYL